MPYFLKPFFTSIYEHFMHFVTLSGKLFKLAMNVRKYKNNISKGLSIVSRTSLGFCLDTCFRGQNKTPGNFHSDFVQAHRDITESSQKLDV